METELVFVVIWVICAMIGGAIGKSKGRQFLGFELGFFLGIIGVVIISLMKPKVTTEKNAAEALGAMPAAFPPPNLAPGGWWPDPMCRHQHRYFDGTRWTDHVSDKGVQSTDPLHRQNQPVA